MGGTNESVILGDPDKESSLCIAFAGLYKLQQAGQRTDVELIVSRLLRFLLVREIQERLCTLTAQFYAPGCLTLTAFFRNRLMRKFVLISPLLCQGMLSTCCCSTHLSFSLINKAVRFAYTTSVPVQKTDIFSFTLFANFLELIDLVDICAEQIIEWYVLVLMNSSMPLITV